jgi:hypothetical protein
MAKNRRVLVKCPRCRSPRFVIDEQGIAIECHSCHRGADGNWPIWRITWEKLEEIRAAIGAAQRIEEPHPEPLQSPHV